MSSRSRMRLAGLAGPKAARELERQMMTMEVVSGDEPETAREHVIELPDPLCFGPYGITPLRGLHFDNDKDTAAS